MSVNRSMRHTKNHRCPVCGGADEDPRGRDKRCFGWTSSDGEWCHCTREELAGSIDAGPDGAYAHRMHGSCRCGVQHGEAQSSVVVRDDIEAMYDYKDERGNLLFQVVRKTGKKFLQRRPDGANWIWQTSGIRRVLFRLPELLAGDKDKPVYIVEGERDVETLERSGYLATTNPGGAGKWGFVAEEARKVLAGRTVVVIADADKPGRDHAKTIQDSLSDVAKVRVIEAPEPHKDATDFVEKGGNLAELLARRPAHSFKIQWAPALAQPLPPVEWLCEGYSIPRKAYCLVAGESYSGKSLWITDLALAIAAGKSAVGLHQAKQGRVLWLDYDGQGERITRTRLQRMARAYGYELSELGENFGYVWLPQARLDDPDAVDKFTALLDGVSFVVIDSWRGACPKTDEKDRAAVQRVGESMLRIIERTGCTPMMVDHTTKPPRERQGGEQRSAMHDIHGSTAKAELAEWVVMFQKAEGKPVKVIHSKERAAAKTMAPFWLRYEDVPQGADPRWGLSVAHLDQEQLNEPSGDFEEKKEAIIRAFKRRKRPMSANDVCAMVPGRRATVLLALKDLLDEGRVHEIAISPGHGSSTTYALSANYDRMPPKIMGGRA